MRKEETLDYLNTYCSVLEFIDRKTPFLEHADNEYAIYSKKVYKLQHRLKGINFFLAWIVVSIVSFVPMSMLNFIIETELNFIVFTPFVAAIGLFLYKMKYEKSTQKMQIKAMKDLEQKAADESKSIVGEINYAKGIADEALTKLLLTEQENHEFDMLSCEKIYTNLAALYYVYGEISDPHSDNISLIANVRNSMNHFEGIIKNATENNNSPDLIKEFEDAKIRAEYRRGVILRCAKMQLTENTNK